MAHSDDDLVQWRIRVDAGWGLLLDDWEKHGACPTCCTYQLAVLLLANLMLHTTDGSYRQAAAMCQQLVSDASKEILAGTISTGVQPTAH